MPDLNQQPNHAAPAPAVAVVIPFYNGSAFIERALRSVAAQSMPAAEVVVVNDGSPPEEREFLQRLQPQYGFTLIDQENGGQGAARNAGVAAASAPYICFLDQDDFYLEHHIRILVNAIPPDDPRLGYVYGELWEADVEGRIISHAIQKSPSQHPKKNVLDMLRYDMFVLPSASLIPRAAFEAVGGFDTQFTGYEDDDLFLRIFRAGFTNYFVDRAVTVWCFHPGSTSYSMRMVRSCLRYFKKLADAFPDEPWLSRYHLRDYLMPRFTPHFVGYTVKTALAGDENRAEMNEILSEYAAIVQANPNVGRRTKLKLRVIVALVRGSPPWLIRAVAPRINSRLIRLLRRLLGQWW
ncbi:MAG: glycosyltransferase family 2 protein [Burkholderiaceae bacterium]|jgi:glycosyltransferase involved in cell wall biosynthesis|nr:glycosyltransferase family 2 protein [Burkholderiaceae bacterium]